MEYELAVLANNVLVRGKRADEISSMLYLLPNNALWARNRKNSELKSWDINNPLTDTLLTSKDTKLKKEGRIDYIFYKNLKKVSSHVIFNSSYNICSDHYSIKSIFKLKKIKMIFTKKIETA